MKLGLAVITHVPKDAGPACHMRLKTFMEYFRETKFLGEFVIIDDNSTSIQHQRYLDYIATFGYGMLHRRNPPNIGAAKNAALKSLESLSCDFMMIAEDDTILMPDFWLPYLEATVRSGIQHFSWSWDQIPWPWDHSSITYTKHQRIYNDWPVVQTSHLNGCFMTFTKKLIDTIGYFKILPNPWGHEHTNYTMRAVAAGMCPFFCDVINSNDYVLMGPYAGASTVPIEKKLEWAVANEFALTIDPSNLYEKG